MNSSNYPPQQQPPVIVPPPGQPQGVAGAVGFERFILFIIYI